MIGSPRVVTIGNTNSASVEAGITLPLDAGLFLDRVDGRRLRLIDRKATLKLELWELRAFEIKP